MLKGLLRDNKYVNLVLRNVLKVVVYLFRPLSALTARYRIYGDVSLKVCGVRFKIHSESDDHIANELFYKLGYEQSEFVLMSQLLRGCRYFIDVGSNTGIFSVWAAKLNPQLEVYSFEPHPSNFERLKRNILLNKVTNIKAISKAVGANNSDITFTIPADFSISAIASTNEAFTKSFHGISYMNLKVPQTTLDEMLSGVPLQSFDVIKIDVEYHELKVLRGAKTILMTKRPLIVIEILQAEDSLNQLSNMVMKNFKQHAKEVFGFLTELNYRGFSIGKDGLKPVDSIVDQKSRNYLFVYSDIPLGFPLFNEN